MLVSLDKIRNVREMFPNANWKNVDVFDAKGPRFAIVWMPAAIAVDAAVAAAVVTSMVAVQKIAKINLQHQSNRGSSLGFSLFFSFFIS